MVYALSCMWVVCHVHGIPCCKVMCVNITVCSELGKTLYVSSAVAMLYQNPHTMQLMEENTLM